MNRRFPVFLFLFVSCTLCFSLLAEASSSESVTFPLRVNAGSPADFKATDGRLFLADQTWSASSWGFLNGGQEEFIGIELYATGGTDIEPVFATQRQAWGEFRVSSIPNGTYLVSLYFREFRAHGPDINRFDILAEGVVAVDDLDIYQHVGRDYALVRQVAVTVSDTELNLTTQLIEGVTNISAISIEPIANNNLPPTVPGSVFGQGSYDGNQIDWAPVSDEDLNGYLVYRSENGGAFSKITADPIYITRYQDRTAEVGKAYSYQVSAVDVFGLESGRSPAVTASRLDVADATLPVFELTIDPLDWEFLYAFPFSENTINGELLYEGNAYDVTVRYRGAGSRLTNKKNWKVKFEGDSPFPDRDTLNLNADNMDFTYMRGPVSYQLFNEIGVDAAQHKFSLLLINGQFMGVYNDYEQIDENFMLRTGRDEDTTIFKAKSNLFEDLSSISQYEAAYEKNNNSSTGHTELIQFIEQTANASDDQFPWVLQNKFDIKSYLDVYAYAVWVGQIDAYTANNYLLYDQETGRWEMIPWDYDFAFGTNPSHFGFTTVADIDLGMDVDRILPKRGVDVPQYRHYFCEKLQEYGTTILAPAALTNTVAEFHSQLLPDARRDWLKVGWEGSSQLENLPAEFGAFAEARLSRMNNQIPAYCSDFDRPYLEINEAVAQNNGDHCDPADSGTSGCDDDWIEIYNEGLTAIDLNGMYLSDTDANLKKHQISGSLIIPPLGHIVIWADGQTGQGANHLSFTLADSNGSIFLSDTDGNMLDTLSWTALPSGHSIARLPDGTEHVETFASPTHSIANTKGAPQISKVSHLPNSVELTDTVTVQATVIDEGRFDVTLHYQVNGGGFTTVPMTEGEGMSWSAVITAQLEDSRIQYYVSAKDKDGLEAIKPDRAPDNVYEYVIGYQPPTLYINELMASNDNVFYDPDEPEESPDYVELYNPGPWAVDLAGMYATDNISKTRKHRLGQETDQLVIGAGEYLIIIADDDGTQGPNHTGFKLSKGGESFGLFDRKDLGNREIDSHTFGPQTTNVAIGRCGDGGAWQVLPIYSPGQSNKVCDLAPPVLSGFAQIPKWPIASNSEPVSIEIDVIDDDAVANVQLNYRIEGAGDWITVPMSKSRDRYTYTLPGIASSGLIIEYYIDATDSNGLMTTYPLGAPENTRRYMYHTTQPEQYPSLAVPSNLIFTEVVANGVSAGINDSDEAGERTPWIELYNNGSTPVDLEGFRLAHSLFFPHDYLIPAGVSIPANGHIVFLLDDDPEQGPLHVAFKPVRLGDTIALYTPHNILVDDVTYGSELENGAVMALIGEDSSAVWQTGVCATPGQVNIAQCNIYLPIVIR